MATKRELREMIEALSQKLGVSVDPDRLERLNNSQLTVKLQELEELEARLASSGPSAEDQPEPARRFSLEPTRRAEPEPPPAAVGPPQPVAEEASTVPPAEPAPAPEQPPQAPPADEAPARPGRYMVAPGKLLKTSSKVLGALRPVKPSDVGGQELFDELVRNGTLVRQR